MTWAVVFVPMSRMFYNILQAADKYIDVDWKNILYGLKSDIEADLNKLLPLEDCIADTVFHFRLWSIFVPAQHCECNSSHSVRSEGIASMSNLPCVQYVT
jgi:hypothetical protein